MTQTTPPHAGAARVEPGLLIRGEWLDHHGDRLEVRNPAHPGEVVGTVPRGTPADVDRAVAAAKAALPVWSALSYPERGEYLGRCLDALDTQIEERAVLFTRENGKPLTEARTELRSVAARQRFTLELVDEFAAVRRSDAPPGHTTVMRRPYGVIVSIVPWNGPVGLAFLQIVPALLAGNTVVVKPPETCPLALIASIELISGLLPPGALNVVTGLPGEIGDRLTSHPDVAKIGFTGSIESARRIIVSASETIKSLTLELGGNDAAILLDDVSLDDQTMKRLGFGIFRLAGQVCMAVKRIYVPRSVESDFLEAFSAAAEQIVVGDGLIPGVTLGPMHTARGLARAKGLLADAAARGATLRTVGSVNDPATHAEGHFLDPTIITGLPDDAPLMREEQFCPAIPISVYDDLEDVLTRANDTIYGLGGSVWGADIERAAAVAARLEAGTVFVNTHGTGWINRREPYGGIKQSGIGRRAGREGLDEWVQTRTLTTFE